MSVNINDYTNSETTARVTVNTTRAPGRAPSWTAQVGNWYAGGKTEREAANRLAEGIVAFARAPRDPRIVVFKGHVAVISAAPSFDQPERTFWAVQVVRPNGGNVSYSSRGGTLADADAATRHGLAQLATDWHDDASVHEGAAFLDGLDAVDYGQYGPDEFYRYAAWQRAAKAAMDAGEPDFHTWATKHAREFEVSRPQ